MGTADGFGRLWMAQTGKSQQHLSQRLQDHRRLERPRDDPLDLSDAQKLFPTQWITTRLQSTGSLPIFFRRQICDHPAARRDRRLLLPQQTTTTPRPRPAPANTTFVEPNGHSPPAATAPAPARKTSFPFLIDYRPVKRVDLYVGVMISNVYGGLANGYQQVQTINPTGGLRIKF